MRRLLSLLLLFSSLPALAGSYWTLPDEMRGESVFAADQTFSLDVDVLGTLGTGTIDNSGGSIVFGNDTTGLFLGKSGTTAAFAGAVSIAQTTTLTALTASQAVFTNASKQLVSNAITGTGNVVMSASPTLSGIVGGALSWSGLQTFGAGATVQGKLEAGLIGTGQNHLFYVPDSGGAPATGMIISAAGSQSLTLGGDVSGAVNHIRATTGLDFYSASTKILGYTSIAITLSKPVLSDLSGSSGQNHFQFGNAFAGVWATKWSSGGQVLTSNAKSASQSSDSWQAVSTGTNVGSVAQFMGINASVQNAWELRAKTTASATAAAFATYFDTPIITATYAGAVTWGPSVVAGVNGVKHVANTGDQGATYSFSSANHGTIQFANYNGTTANPVIMGTSNDTGVGSGLSLVGLTNNGNTLGDVLFDARETDGTAHADTTQMAYNFRYAGGSIAKLLRNGNANFTYYTAFGGSPGTGNLQNPSVQMMSLEGGYAGGDYRINGATGLVHGITASRIKAVSCKIVIGTDISMAPGLIYQTTPNTYYPTNIQWNDARIFVILRNPANTATQNWPSMSYECEVWYEAA